MTMAASKNSSIKWFPFYLGILGFFIFGCTDLSSLNERSDGEDVVQLPVPVTGAQLTYHNSRVRCAYKIKDLSQKQYEVNCYTVAINAAGSEEFADKIEKGLSIAWLAPVVQQGTYDSLSCSEGAGRFTLQCLVTANVVRLKFEAKFSLQKKTKSESDDVLLPYSVEVGVGFTPAFGLGVFSTPEELKEQNSIALGLQRESFRPEDFGRGSAQSYCAHKSGIFYSKGTNIYFLDLNSNRSYHYAGQLKELQEDPTHRLRIKFKEPYLACSEDKVFAQSEQKLIELGFESPPVIIDLAPLLPTDFQISKAGVVLGKFYYFSAGNYQRAGIFALNLETKSVEQLFGSPAEIAQKWPGIEYISFHVIAHDDESIFIHLDTDFTVNGTTFNGQTYLFDLNKKTWSEKVVTGEKTFNLHSFSDIKKAGQYYYFTPNSTQKLLAFDTITGVESVVKVPSEIAPEITKLTPPNHPTYQFSYTMPQIPLIKFQDEIYIAEVKWHNAKFYYVFGKVKANEQPVVTYVSSDVFKEMPPSHLIVSPSSLSFSANGNLQFYDQRSRHILRVHDKDSMVKAQFKPSSFPDLADSWSDQYMGIEEWGVSSFVTLENDILFFIPRDSLNNKIVRVRPNQKPEVLAHKNTETGESNGHIEGVAENIGALNDTDVIFTDVLMSYEDSVYCQTPTKFKVIKANGSIETLFSFREPYTVPSTGKLMHLCEVESISVGKDGQIVIVEGKAGDIFIAKPKSKGGYEVKLAVRAKRLPCFPAHCSFNISGTPHDLTSVEGEHFTNASLRSDNVLVFIDTYQNSLQTLNLNLSRDSDERQLANRFVLYASNKNAKDCSGNTAKGETTYNDSLQKLKSTLASTCMGTLRDVAVMDTCSKENGSQIMAIGQMFSDGTSNILKTTTPCHKN